MEIFVVAKKSQNVLLTTYDRESMPEKSWNLTNLVWGGPGAVGASYVRSIRSARGRKGAWSPAEIACHPGPYRIADRFKPNRVANDCCQVKKSKLLAGEDPQNRGYRIRILSFVKYFGEQLRTQRIEAWKECNRRLYNHYRELAPQLPDSFRDMEPLFLAVICGCRAGLFLEALHEIYIPRIQRGNASFAANVLGARGALLSVLAYFFEAGRWGSPVQVGVGGQHLTAEDQLFLLLQAGLYLTSTRGLGAPEVRYATRAPSPCVVRLMIPDSCM